MDIPKRNITNSLFRLSSCRTFFEEWEYEPQAQLEYENAVNAINEGLIISYPIDNVANYLSKIYRLLPADYFDSVFDNSYLKLYNSKYRGVIGITGYKNNQEQIYVIVLESMKNTVYNAIQNKLNLIGYIYAGSKEISNQQNDTTLDWIILFFEKRFNEKYKIDISKKKYLYHITSKENYDKIKIRGLRTVSNNTNRFSHDERIYFKTIAYSRSDFEYYSGIFADRNNLDKNKSFAKEYVLLRILTDKLSNIDFYYDPRMEFAVYTFENIPANFIEAIDKCIVIYNGKTKQITVK